VVGAIRPRFLVAFSGGASPAERWRPRPPLVRAGTKRKSRRLASPTISRFAASLNWRRRSLHLRSGHGASHMAIAGSEPRIPPPPRLGAYRVLALQLTPPVAEVLQRQPLPLAILTLRRPAKLPDLEVAAPESSDRCSLFQTKGQCGSPSHAQMRDRSQSHRRGREQTVQEMDGYNGSLIRATNSLIIP
jgi:hypothetical protein